jgi:hypothetical protein
MGAVQLELYARPFQCLYLLSDGLFGKTVRRNAVCQQPACLRLALIYSHSMSALPQIIGCSQPGRAGTYHSHLFPAFTFRDL